MEKLAKPKDIKLSTLYVIQWQFDTTWTKKIVKTNNKEDTVIEKPFIGI